MNNSYVPHSNGNKHTNNAQGGGREGVCVVLLNKSGKAFLRVTLERDWQIVKGEAGGLGGRTFQVQGGKAYAKALRQAHVAGTERLTTEKEKVRKVLEWEWSL